MKLITQERLIAALDSVQQVCDERTDRLRSIVELYGLHGYKNIVERKADAVIAAVQVDAKLLSLDMKESKQVIDSWFEKTEYFSRWREVVFKIQSDRKISGLVKGTQTLGDRSISVSLQHEKLRLIEADLSILAQEKEKIVTFFLENVEKQQHKIFLDRNGFSCCSVEDLLYYSTYYQWAIVRESIDDYCELIFVNGLDPESYRADTKWFVSSHAMPRF
jgi:hypothetical protein